MESFHATTILSVRKNGKVVLGGDGQVTLGNTVVKANARKIRRLGKNSDVLEPEHGLIAIGSGGPYAQAAAKALLDNSDLEARQIVEKALGIAGDNCIYTNHNVTIEELGTENRD
jgi:ATP-dependent protease HslVU (ClpYQ) peptidase subunit